MTRKKNLPEITAIVLLGLASGKPLVSSDEQHKAVDESADVVSWTQLVPAEELRAKVDFGPGYVVGGVHLEAGMYLLVHRKLAGVEGIYFYRMPYRPGQESIAKLRCTPIAGAPVDRLTVRGTRQGDGTFAVQTVQFPGSREIHSFERAD